MIGDSGKEMWKERDDQESRRMGKDSARDRESQGALRKLGLVVLNICFEDFDLAECGRLATNQLVHACAGNPVPFSKGPGQVLQAVNFVKVTFEQGDLEEQLSTDGGRAVGVLDAEPGLGHTALSKTLPSKSKPLSRVDIDSSESSGPPVGRLIRSIPKSWKAQAAPVDLEYSYDATSDVHTINPVHAGVIDESDDFVRSTLVVKSVNGIVTIPINCLLAESKNIFEVHNTGTQTEDHAFHGLQE